MLQVGLRSKSRGNSGLQSTDLDDTHPQAGDSEGEEQVQDDGGVRVRVSSKRSRRGSSQQLQQRVSSQQSQRTEQLSQQQVRGVYAYGTCCTYPLRCSSMLCMLAFTLHCSPLLN